MQVFPLSPASETLDAKICRHCADGDILDKGQITSEAVVGEMLIQLF